MLLIASAWAGLRLQYTHWTWAVGRGTWVLTEGRRAIYSKVMRISFPLDELRINKKKALFA